MFEPLQQLKIQHNQVYPYLHVTNELTHLQNILRPQAPLVSIHEIKKLRQFIARAAEGEYFLIQLGDCAENAYECDEDTLYAKLEFIQRVTEFFQRKTGSKVIQVGRITGQYVRPRNHLFYQEINQWNRGIDSEQKIYTSHEAFLSDYEHVLTRPDKRTGLYYNLSTHFPCLDEHTVSSNYLKHIANPMAVKVGPNTSINSLIKTINELDPYYLPGRITLIPRLGVQTVNHLLPQLIEAVKKTQRTVLWSCDPMHGNTETNSSGMKIRKLSNIIDEIKSSFEIHKQMGSKLNAIHLEATNQDVTECLDYDLLIDLKNRSKNQMEPRLNYEQTIHVIQCVARYCVTS